MDVDAWAASCAAAVAADAHAEAQEADLSLRQMRLYEGQACDPVKVTGFGVVVVDALKISEEQFVGLLYAKALVGERRDASLSIVYQDKDGDWCPVAAAEGDFAGFTSFLREQRSDEVRD